MSDAGLAPWGLLVGAALIAFRVLNGTPQGEALEKRLDSEARKMVPFIPIALAAAAFALLIFTYRELSQGLAFRPEIGFWASFLGAALGAGSGIVHLHHINRSGKVT